MLGFSTGFIRSCVLILVLNEVFSSTEYFTNISLTGGYSATWAAMMYPDIKGLVSMKIYMFNYYGIVRKRNAKIHRSFSGFGCNI